MKFVGVFYLLCALAWAALMFQAVYWAPRHRRRGDRKYFWSLRSRLKDEGDE